MTPAVAKAFTVSASVRSGFCTLAGLTVRETAGAAARIRVYDGTTATGTVVAASSLAANGAETIWLGAGVRCDTGIYVEVVTGAVEGSVYVA